MTPWPHQTLAHDACRDLYGDRSSWAVFAPCGAGKSYMMTRIAVPAAQRGKRVAIYSPRVMLTTQLERQFSELGVDFGVNAAGFHPNPDAPIQICSLQTIYSRLGNFKHPFPSADIVIVDEAHQQTSTMAQQVFEKHQSTCEARIGFTATPVNLGDLYEEIVSTATYQALRDCKAHLPVVCYGPDRPDLSKLKTNSFGEFSRSDDSRINGVPSIVGRVYEYWMKLNPNALPAIGFAPGVEHSKGFVHKFQQRGVPCAHIDAERTLLVQPNANGMLIASEYPTTSSTREEVLQGSKEGRYKIVWNRFVLREAVDMPWLYHAISATSMGGLSTYLQSLGRVMRYWPAYDEVIIQDHGGNIDRHGMPDMDRDWTLGCTNKSMHKQEQARRQKTKGDNAEPICCPRCNNYRTHGPQCPHCGHLHKRSVRLVRELDGRLVKKIGRDVKYKPPKTFDDYFRSALYGGYSKCQTVKQAYKVAKIRAEKDGVKLNPAGTVFVPPTGDARWHRSIRDVYPTFKPRHIGGSFQ